MQRVCLALPTMRPCPETIAELAEEAAYAVATFGVEVHLLVLDTTDAAEFAQNAAAVAALEPTPGVVVHHLGEAQQRKFLRRVAERTGAADPELLLDLMLPRAVAYGSCVNRLFLAAAALGCTSAHLRNDDADFQVVDGRKVFPIHHELLSIGRPAGEAVAGVSRSALDPADADKPVMLVSGSFIGELCVDIGEIHALDPAVYREVVRLWAPPVWSEEEKDAMVDVSFKGAGSEPFGADDSVLGVPDIWDVYMCNTALDHRAYEALPLLPSTETIGSDYALLHALVHARLPGVTHNRHIVNYYTPERRTGAGFVSYQLRFVKFLLSMLYLYPVYGGMIDLGRALLDERHGLRVEPILDLVRGSVDRDRSGNEHCLDVLDRCYRKLGGKYAELADVVAGRRQQLLDEARADAERWAVLIEAWAALVAAARAEGIGPRAAGSEPRAEGPGA
ncbi:hypothetical protein BX285_6027 [Streptomyces sp. 1114.5]|uniref:DUF6271 family protein n=1 Tax=Streptomyces sp. 1114.5 TaxID=1938830 RepID=UPI000EB2FB28|nr:DUF6271 family protein [Streptomyces sp. 1114.5]RKT12061.1 hypothetical protein BX285_6027 [Streptomyces sp. 1114.5]